MYFLLMWLKDDNSQNALALLPLRGHSQTTPTSYRRQNPKNEYNYACFDTSWVIW